MVIDPAVYWELRTCGQFYKWSPIVEKDDEEIGIALEPLVKSQWIRVSLTVVKRINKEVREK